MSALERLYPEPGNTIPAPIDENPNMDPVEPVERPKSKRSGFGKRWVLTLNNYTHDDWTKMESVFNKDCIKYIIAKEVGEQGTPHIQGFCHFQFRTRAIEKYKHTFSKPPHWEFAKGDDQEQVAYITKEGGELKSKNLPMPVRVKVTEENMYEWQKKVLQTYKDHLQNEDERAVYWVKDSQGQRGKSALAKFMAVTHSVPWIRTGRAQDIAYLLAEDMPSAGVILDLPRHQGNECCPLIIEQLKDGGMTSTKFKSKNILFNSFWVCIFSNYEPNYETLSRDRWRVMNLDKNECDFFPV